MQLEQPADEASVRVGDASALLDVRERLVEWQVALPHEVRDDHRRRARDTLVAVDIDLSTSATRRPVVQQRDGETTGG